jgi:tetratricopeptide (TPR) repeat protein
MLVQLIRHYSQEGSLSLPDGPLEMDPTRWLTDLDLDQQTVAGVLALAELPLSLESISAIAQVPAETVLPELVRRAIALEEGGSWKLAAEILRAPLQALVFDPEGMEARIKEHHPQAEVLPEDPLLMEVAQLQAQARLSEAIALLSARIEEPGQLLSRRQVQLGLLEWQHGDLSASWTHFAAALGAVQPTVRAQAHIGIGLAALHIGHIQAALDHLQHGRVEAELAGDRTLEVLAWLNLASAHLWAGALASASLDAQRALGLARSIGERKLECRALLMIGQVRLALEQAVEAGRVLADASALAKALDLEEERLLAHVLRAWSSLKEHPMDRTAAAAALDRLATQRALSVDPEGIFLQLRALRAWALAATGDRIRAERLRADINTSGVRVVVRLKLELLLLEAARAAGAALEVQERAARLLQESDAWGFVYASWKVRRILTAVTGEASPEIFTVSTGLSEEEKRILLESDRPR